MMGIAQAGECYRYNPPRLIRRVLVQRSYQRKSVLSGHRNVAYKHIGNVACDSGQTLLRRLGRGNLRAEPAQKLRERFPRIAMIFDDENLDALER
jgi:hypothetical protein